MMIVYLSQGNWSSPATPSHTSAAPHTPSVAGVNSPYGPASPHNWVVTCTQSQPHETRVTLAPGPEREVIRAGGSYELQVNFGNMPDRIVVVRG